MALTFLLLWLTGCASSQSQYFEDPSLATKPEDAQLFKKALKEQKREQYGYAVKLWQEFLATNPGSYEGHSNLGLIYFIEDQLNHAIKEFETAYDLSPQSEKVYKNYTTALDLKVTMLKENHEYEKAMVILNRLFEIATPRQKRDVRELIEDVDGRIFEGVKRANTVKAYEEYLKKYPKGYNVVEANERLIELRGNPGRSSLEPVPSTSGETKNAEAMDFPEEPAETMDAIENAPAADIAMEPLKEEDDIWGTKEDVVKDSEWEAKTPTPSPAKADVAKPEVAVAVLEEKKPEASVEQKNPVHKPTQSESDAMVPLNTEVAVIVPRSSGVGSSPSTEEEMAALVPMNNKVDVSAFALETEVDKKPVSSEATQSVKVIVKVEKFLEIHAEPSSLGKVIGMLKNNDICILVDEIEGWYKVKYVDDKIGWISQKFSQKLNGKS